MSVDALDGLRALTFGSKEKFWEVSILGKEIKKIIYERTPPGNIPARSVSGVTYTKMAKIAILEMADLAALQPWDRSGVHTGSILAGLECRRAIRTVQPRIPDS